MTAEEKQQVVALLEEIAKTIFDWTLLSPKSIAESINRILKRFPVIPGRMGEDLKIREIK